MGYFCYSCSTDLKDDVRHGKVGRTQSCPKCSRDMHVCKNCKHYDPAAYNECRETSAERVVDKEKSNFCDYFSFIDKGPGGGTNGKKDHLKALDDLFK